MNSQEKFYSNRDLETVREGAGTLEERSQTFIDDIMDGIEDPALDPLLAMSSNGKRMVQAFSPSPIQPPLYTQQ